ncbi:hypothetical protein [Rhizobium grahamii]|uniref:hypothetical protein n=1 Tax=Rhizobium grahamii TaxID=1120045 RepID=UPI00031D8D0E|nr:hypothetical protein [Rhizobium grahamii]
MGFRDKPTVTVGIEEKDGGWRVVTTNADGKARQERDFHSKAEAHAYWLAEVGRTKNQ